MSHSYSYWNRNEHVQPLKKIYENLTGSLKSLRLTVTNQSCITAIPSTRQETNLASLLFLLPGRKPILHHCYSFDPTGNQFYITAIPSTRQETNLTTLIIFLSTGKQYCNTAILSSQQETNLASLLFLRPGRKPILHHCYSFDPAGIQSCNTPIPSTRQESNLATLLFFLATGNQSCNTSILSNHRKPTMHYCSF
ncbi:hypothetical protein CHS0354_030433 [Potamilus streckersoni]|uniref:Uncharacterized protein n=1 Tax=Potamilus streckersoni TaxID=2493646 RepID=A0AAE0S8F7_9BIVA|nr:hypothetical protein CHS0354_030433 [Potamilus streckersoni]